MGQRVILMVHVPPLAGCDAMAAATTASHARVNEFLGLGAFLLVGPPVAGPGGFTGRGLGALWVDHDSPHPPGGSNVLS